MAGKLRNIFPTSFCFCFAKTSIMMMGSRAFSFKGHREAGDIGEDSGRFLNPGRGFTTGFERERKAVFALIELN